MSEEIEKHILERYEVFKKMGRGAYGIVWKAKDKKTSKIVALKKVFEAFQNSVDAQRTYREVMYLQELNGHDNIVRLLSIIRAYNNKDLYLVFEYMETDLHSVIKAKILDNIHKKFIVYQLLKGLKYIHSADLLHRDLKPSNLLINSDCNIKIADFGLARSVAAKENGEEITVSDYVATRWYRAPEILLGSQKYSKAVDVWSTGCILAELVHGKTLFAGKSTINQIELIIQLLGNPSKNDIVSINSPLAENILSAIKTSKKRSFGHLFSSVGKEGLDLLRKMLRFNPESRITVDEALKHKFFERFHCDEDEIICDRIIRLPIDDNIKLSLKMYRDAIYKDISQKIKKSRTKGVEEKEKKLPKIRNPSISKDRKNNQSSFRTEVTSPKSSHPRGKDIKKVQKSQQFTKSTLNSRSQKRSTRNNRKSKKKLRDGVRSPKRGKESSKRMKKYIESSAKNYINKHISKKSASKNTPKMFMRRKSKAEKSKKKPNVKLYRSISPSTGKNLFSGNQRMMNSGSKFFKSKKSLQSSSQFLLKEKPKKKQIIQGSLGSDNFKFSGGPSISKLSHKKSSSYVSIDKKLRMSKSGVFGRKKSGKRVRAYGGYFIKGKPKNSSKGGINSPNFSFKR